MARRSPEAEARYKAYQKKYHAERNARARYSYERLEKAHRVVVSGKDLSAELMQRRAPGITGETPWDKDLTVHPYKWRRQGMPKDLPRYVSNAFGDAAPYKSFTDPRMLFDCTLFDNMTDEEIAYFNDEKHWVIEDLDTDITLKNELEGEPGVYGYLMHVNRGRKEVNNPPKGRSRYKRKDGKELVWDDPRLVSIAALRRRGYTPESIKRFVELVGVSKANSSVDSAMLEYCIREDLKLSRARMMAVLKPLKLIIDNYPEGQIEELEMPNNLENPELGNRTLPFGRELWIEEDDFREEPPKKYFRLFPGNEVRLMGAYFVKCVGVDKDENGKVIAVHCTYDPETKSGTGFEGRKVKGTIHWVNASTAVNAECRLYENLVDEEKGKLDENGNLNLNPNSRIILKDCKLEPNFEGAKAYDSYQFVRNGFFCVDSKDSTPENLVFNRIVSLKSSFKL